MADPKDKDAAESSIQRGARLFVRAASMTEQSSSAATPDAGCPVAPAAATPSSSSPPPACPASSSAAAAATPPSSCPTSGSDQYNRLNNMPHVPNAPADSSSSSGLGTQRQTSSIPMAEPASSSHQPGDSPVWVYPSEQMFFNAMKRKGWDPEAQDMPTIVAIHNTVNERAWREVLQWEALHAARCPLPRLKRFQGRPAEFSPKARLLNFLGYKLPFDRHDWIVDRCGQEVRYVIDFYNAVPQQGSEAPVAMHLDVRPALDSWEALHDRLRVQFKWVGSMRWMSE